MIHYNRIEAALTSLSDATDRSISLRNDTFQFSGLNSELISHQTCRHAPGHRVPQTVIFSNNRYTMIVAAYSSFAKFSPAMPEYQSPYRGAWREIPAHLIRHLFKFPAVTPEWVAKNDWTLFAMVPDFFLKFDDEGTPIFRPDCKITANVPDGQGGENLRVLFKEDRSEAIDSATGLKFFDGRVWTNNGPLPSGWISNIGEVEPSNEFKATIPNSVGEFHCSEKTDNWYWHPAGIEKNGGRS